MDSISKIIEHGHEDPEAGFVLLEPVLKLLLERVLVKRRRRFLRRVKSLLARRRMREFAVLYRHLQDSNEEEQAKRKISNRIAWVLPRPRSWFDSVLLTSYEENAWMEHFRVSRKTFQYICGVFGPEIARQDTIMRDAIPVEKRVAVSLWRLATGKPYTITGEKFGIGRCTSLKIKDEFCDVLVRKAKDFIKFPKTESDTKVAIEGFESVCRIPQVVGALDAVRFRIKAPSLVAHKMKYYNDKTQCHSMTLQAVANSNGSLIHVSTGYPGGISNAEALKMSDMYENVNEGVILHSPSSSIEGQDIKPLIAASPAYKLHKWCMSPYLESMPLTPSQRKFNDELSTAVKVVKATLAKLRGRWRCLVGCLEENVEKIPETVLLCCVLHNICVNQDDPTVIEPYVSDSCGVPDRDDDTDHGGEGVREALRAHIDLLQY